MKKIMDNIPMLINENFLNAKYVSFKISRGTPQRKLTIYLRSKDDQVITLVFSHSIQFSYKIGDKVKELYEISNNSDLLDEAVLNYYINVPENHPFKLFQIEDIHNRPFLQIVAECVEVIKNENK